MACCHYYTLEQGGDAAFSINVSQLTFGPGCVGEAGDRARELGLKRVALFTDRRLAELPFVHTARRSLEEAGVDCAVYSEVEVEPTDASFQAAARFALEGRFDGFVSVGGGSVIDTCKAANLFATHPAEFTDYVNAPLGAGRPVPGPLKPHIACPTTSGTGSETTGVAVFDFVAKKLKTGIASKHMIPTLALVDPDAAATLPGTVLAASGFDALSHALECYTCRPHTMRTKPARASARPLYNGANPWSDIAAREALRLIGKYLVRAASDPADTEARGQMMYAGTLAGMAFGNGGCHLPHGMSYAVAGLVRDYRAPDYPHGHPMVPHGMAVILNAPSVYRYTASACPDRHLEGAECLGADVRGATPDDAGEVVAKRIIAMMQATRFPAGLAAVGYGETDLNALAEGAFPQKRLLDNSPRPASKDDLAELFRGAMRYW
jgi:hydroxyacid-oxoacid transhydrogenase